MCLINFKYEDHATYKLVVAANRDEFYGRPTAPAHFWEDHPHILAGRDLEQMGTWMGITKKGRFAALTNYRDPRETRDGKKSRGEIVREFLTGDEDPSSYLQQLKLQRDRFQGFNVIVGDGQSLYYYSNVQNEIVDVVPGTHGLSNHLLNTEWPKVVKGKRGLDHCTKEEEVEESCLFTMLQNADHAPDEELPQTGVSFELERQLSPLFIQIPNYGTRSSTVMTIDRNNVVRFVERTYKEGKVSGEKEFRFQIEI